MYGVAEVVTENRPRPLPLFLDLVREMAQQDPDMARRALAGLALYQKAERVGHNRPQHIFAKEGRVSLIDYGGDGDPVMFIPSIINPHIILDLSQNNSLIGHVRAAGFRPLLVDWGFPTSDDRDETINTLISQYLAPLAETVAAQISTPHLVGYCLGGTMALAAAHQAPAKSLTMIASPWHFDHYGEDRHMLSRLWADNAAACHRLGLVPMEVLQTAFWRMDLARTVRKYAHLVERDANALAQFVALEDWANDGAPLSYACGEDLFVRFFRDNLPGSGGWRIGGTVIRPETVPCPARQFVSTTDRIVPLASCAAAIEAIPSSAGHVGMVVGSQAPTTLWEPLVKWLSQVQHK